MKRMLINATQPDELRVAITDDARLIDLDIETPGQEQKKSNIYKGHITSIERSLGAVFVDYGSERHGFLPLNEISTEYFLTEVKSREDIDINKILKLGQELVVQVEKEERGTKGAALTTFISLAGAYLVLMPNNPRAGGISRRIEGDERNYLKETVSKLDVPEGMSIIIRTAGVDQSAEELKRDLDILLRFWEAIKQAAIAKPGPYLIYEVSDGIFRAIRDYLRQDIEEIIVDDPNAYERARHYLTQVRPDFLSRLKLYSNHLPLFSRFQIEQQIEAAYQREVQLPSGGSIVIDATEALISIDINSARATKGGNIEETAHNTNIEAAEEIARQLRIRDIGGLIVIDFIDMTTSKNRRDVENTLRKALQPDRARIQISSISRFGLLEMSRQRLRAALSRSTQITCPRCSGRGTIRGVESMSLSVIHLIQESASRTKDAVIQVQLPLDTATYLLNEKRDVLKNIETHSQNEIVVIPNTHLISPQYQIKEVKSEHSKTIPSYQLPKIVKVDSPIKKTPATKKLTPPVISEFLSTTPSSTSRTSKSSGGVIRRLWELMFGSDEPNAQSQAAKKKPARKKQTPSQPKKHPRSPSRSNAKKATRRGSRGGSGNRRQSGGLSQQQQKRKQIVSAPTSTKSKNLSTQTKIEQTKTPQEKKQETLPKQNPIPQTQTKKTEPKLEQVITKVKDKN